MDILCRLLLACSTIICVAHSSPNSSIVISFEDRLEIIDGESATVVESFSLSPTINYIVSITSDGHDLFLSDYKDEGTTLFEIRLEKNIQIIPLVKHNSLNLAEGMAFDSASKKLYFSDSKKRKISSINLSKKKLVQDILTLDSPHEKLRDVAIDFCHRRLYWVNWNSKQPRIEFINLDSNQKSSSGIQVFIDTNLTKPRSLIYDYWDLRLYWIDTNDNHEYRIERANPDGSGREVICKGSGNSPYDITVTKGYIFWSDWMNMVIWRVDKFNDNCELTAVKYLKSSRPMGIASLSFPDKCLEKSFIDLDLSKKIEPATDHIVESSSTVVSTEICKNYCIHGNCSVTAINFPLCHCQFGYTGSRCQNDLCHNYCLNRGICRFPKSNKGQPTCQCVGNFSGPRCQFDRSKERIKVQQVKDISSSKVFLYGFVFTSSTTGLLLILLTAITIKTYREKKGVYIPQKNGSSENLIQSVHPPPQTERKKVIKNSSSSCSGKSSCSAVVDIEDCCQMTLCDSPCVEASFRKPRRRGFSHGDDDKANLLDNDALVHKAEDLF